MISMNILLYCAAPLLSPDRTADSDDPFSGLHTPTSTLMFQPAPHYEHQKVLFHLPYSFLDRNADSDDPFSGLDIPTYHSHYLSSYKLPLMMVLAQLSHCHVLLP